MGRTHLTPLERARRWLALLAMATLALGLAACGEDDGAGDGKSSSGTGGDGGGGGTGGHGTGGNGTGGTTTGTTSSGGTGGEGGVVSSYPPPPYGNEVDDTFPLLGWEGWINPGADQLATSGTYIPFDSEGIRNAGESHALIHLAADF